MRFVAVLSLATTLFLSSAVLSALAVSLPNVLNLENIDNPKAYEDWETSHKPPAQAPFPYNPPGPKLPTPRPLVVWHGLGTHLYYDVSTEERPIDIPSIGDNYASPGMLEFMQLIKEIHNNIFIHSVYLDVDPTADQKAGWVSLRSGYPQQMFCPFARLLTDWF